MITMTLIPGVLSRAGAASGASPQGYGHHDLQRPPVRHRIG
jgi:hypothetical protein